MIDKKLLQMRFSKNARTYNQYANVQKKMAEELLHFSKLQEIAPDQITRILDIGCGTGYLTKLLCTLFPCAMITAIDLAPGMIEIAKEYCPTTSKLKFICGDIEEMAFSGHFDLIISNATFQWFNQLPTTLNKLDHLLSAQGLLCFSTFGTQTFSELHEAYDKARVQFKLDTACSPGQAFYSLPDLTQLCADSLTTTPFHGYKKIESEETFEYEYFDCAKDFFHSVKKIGANNSNTQGTHPSPILIHEVIKIYDSTFKENEKVKATYHCLFFKITPLLPKNDLEVTHE